MAKQQTLMETRTAEAQPGHPGLVEATCEKCGARCIPVLKGSTVRCKGCGNWQETG